jgi:flagellar hook-associated protein 3 FlgL
MAPIYRTSQGTLTSSVTANMQAALARAGRTQEKLSSGKEISKPSDSPTGAAAALRYRTDIKATEQHGRNASDGLGWLGAADSALSQTLEAVSRVKELALSGSTATSDQGAREALAAEVDQLRGQVISQANTKYLDRGIFAGTADVNAGWDSNGNMVGDPASMSRKVERTVAPDVKIPVNADGPAIFGDSSSGLLKLLSDVADHLRADPASLTSDLTGLDTSFQNVTNALTDVGARYNRIEAMQSRAEDTKLNLKSGLSEVEDIDLPKTIMDLQVQQVAYQAALQASAKVIQPTLMDFLR